MSRILVVDGDFQLCERLTNILNEADYRVHSVNKGECALTHIQTHPVDLVLLGALSPYTDSLQIARRICQRFATPLLMFTPFDDEESMLASLNAGADQCLARPFSSNELLARMTSLLRRVALEKQRLKLVKYSESFAFKLSGLSLTETEMQLLQFLIQHEGETISKAILQKKVLKKEISAFDRNLDMHISNIRRKMLHAGLPKLHLKTVHGKGYTFSEFAT